MRGTARGQRPGPARCAPRPAALGPRSPLPRREGSWGRARSVRKQGGLVCTRAGARGLGAGLGLVRAPTIPTTSENRQERDARAHVRSGSGDLSEFDDIKHNRPRATLCWHAGGSLREDLAPAPCGRHGTAATGPGAFTLTRGRGQRWTRPTGPAGPRVPKPSQEWGAALRSPATASVWSRARPRCSGELGEQALVTWLYSHSCPTPTLCGCTLGQAPGHVRPDTVERSGEEASPALGFSWDNFGELVGKREACFLQEFAGLGSYKA